MRTSGDRRPAEGWLYAIVIGSLALYLVIGVIAWTWMILAGVDVPSGFTTVLSTIAGGLIGIVAPTGRAKNESSAAKLDRAS